MADDEASRVDIRIAVVAPPGSAAFEIRRALGRLGEGVAVEVLHDPESAFARMAPGAADLVILDDGLGAELLELLARAPEDGAPALVVCERAGEAPALEAFRVGASDCVARGPQFAEVLPIAALEQIRRHRAASERGEAERRIRWLERLHDAIVSEIPAALVVIDPLGRVVTVNPEFSRLFEMPDRWAEGRAFQDVVPQELLESGGVGEVLARAAAGRAVAPRVTRIERGGAQRAFDVRAQRLDEEGRVLLVLSEVTEAEALSEQVRDLRRYTENIIQNMNGALVVVDLEGTVTFANPTAERILGAGQGALIGHPLWSWLVGDAGGRALVERTLRDGVRFRGSEAMVTRPGGENVPIGISCAPVVDARGTKRGAVAIFQDLTETKQLQRQVLQTEKMASIGQLAAGVAHEINNPMAFIHANLFQLGEYLEDLARVWERIGPLRKALAAGDLEGAGRVADDLTELCRELDPDFLIGDSVKAVRESLEGSERIRHIVQDLRAFSHEDTGERELADLNQCLDSTAHIVWTMMKHSVSLTKDYQTLPPVRCYPMQLKQVFMNLLVNAYQAIEAAALEDGRVGRVRLHTCQRGAEVEIAVEDNGVGIAREQLGRIFDPFFTTKDVGVGTGLGLSTSYNIVRRHGGELRVESEPGVGTRFTISLPIAEAAPTQAAGAVQDDG